MSTPTPGAASVALTDEQIGRLAVANEIRTLLRVLPLAALDDVLRHVRDVVCEHLQEEREPETPG